MNSELYTKLLHKAYELYKADWCDSRGFNLKEVESANCRDQEYKGQMYACLLEFEDCEFADVEYMQELLTQEDFAVYVSLVAEENTPPCILRVAVIEGDYARDTQIFIGTKEDAVYNIAESDCWADVKHASLFLGVYQDSNEETIRKRLSNQLGVIPEAITLYDVDKGW